MFVTNFVIVSDNDDDDDFAEEPFYMKALRQILETEDPFFYLNGEHLFQYDQKLYSQLICYPAEIIPIFDLVVNQLFKEAHTSSNI
jgi:DNA replication licensing factor MCM4